MRTSEGPDLTKYGDRPITPEDMQREEEENMRVAEALKVNADPKEQAEKS